MDATEFTATSDDWLKADELKGHTVTLEIESVEVVEFDNESGKDRKLGLRFKDKEKGIICNKTNAKNLVNGLGADTDNWVGQKVTAAPNNTPLGLGFSVRPLAEGFDDEIPF